jgi:ribosomal protein L37AE/L43A
MTPMFAAISMLMSMQRHQREEEERLRRLAAARCAECGTQGIEPNDGRLWYCSQRCADTAKHDATHPRY